MTVSLAPNPVSSSKQRDTVIDVDIHAMPRCPTDLTKYMAKRWQQHMQEYGQSNRQAYVGGTVYPKAAPELARRDSWPPNGGLPGSDLDFMRLQHLNPNDIEIGVLQMVYPNIQERNSDLAIALCSAANDWQLAEWTDLEPRLKGSIVVPSNDPIASKEEISKRAGNRAFAQIMMTPRTFEPIGGKRYWPIFEAAAEHDLPIGMHAGGANGLPVTASGWPSFYIEEHQCQAMVPQAALMSMIFNGVFEQFPTLRLLVVEAGFGFVPSLGWRMDKVWETNRSELPNVKLPPSEYLRRNVWFSTQPIEETKERAELIELVSWIGWDRLLFASDYPHWDFDDPRYAFKIPMTSLQKRAVLSENARSVYRFK
jgi:predicted TIM-barrel fold metal-dependent hydrolase